MACGGELEFEAPLARFDVEEWTEFYDQNDSSPDADVDLCSEQVRQLRPDVRDSSDLHRLRYHEAGQLLAASAVSENGRKTLPVTSDLSSSGSSSAAGSGFAEQFGETSLSGSLEDLVNTFDENVTKCCKNYQEEVEKLAPVQMRNVEEALSECQNWYTLTGNYGNLLPINWSSTCSTLARLRRSPKRSEMSQSEDDVEDDEEQFCSVEELDQFTGDFQESVSPKKFEDNESLDDVDNADDVIDELEALMDEREIDYALQDEIPSMQSLSKTTSIPDVTMKSSSSSGSVKKETWFPDDVKKLSTVALRQLSADLLRMVVEFNNVLRQELTLSDELKCENRLCRELIALTLTVERKLKLRLQQHQIAEQQAVDDDDDDDDDEYSDGAVRNSYLATVIPYRPSDGRLTIQRLQVYITLLSAIENDSQHVPRLLTDYILNVLCPVN